MKKYRTLCSYFIWPQIFRITSSHNVPVPEIKDMLTPASEGPPNYFRTPDGCTPNRSILIYVEHLLACIVFKRRGGSVAAPWQTERGTKAYHRPADAHTMINIRSASHTCRCFSESSFHIAAVKLAFLLPIRSIGA